MLRGMICSRPDVFGYGSGDDIHCLGNKDDVPALYHLPNGTDLSWQEIVGIEPLCLRLLFIRGELLKRTYRSAAHQVYTEQFIDERVELVPANMQEIVRRVGVKQRPTDVH